MLDLSIIELGELEGCSLEGLIDKKFLVLFVEVQFTNWLVEGWVDAQGVFEVFDEVLDEEFRELNLFLEKSLQGAVNPDPLFDAESSGSYVLLKELKIHLFPFIKGDVEELISFWFLRICLHDLNNTKSLMFH